MTLEKWEDMAPEERLEHVARSSPLSDTGLLSIVTANAALYLGSCIETVFGPEGMFGPEGTTPYKTLVELAGLE